jgi:hypothetical protein
MKTAMTLGEDYDYKDGAESMILSAGLLLSPLPPCCRPCYLCLCRGRSSGSTGVGVCRCRGKDIATTVVDFVFVFIFIFVFLLHADGASVSHLFPAADIGVTALSVAAVVILGTVVPQVETKIVPMTMIVATRNETRHGMPSTLPSNPRPREDKGKGDEGEGGGHCCGRQW